MHPDAPRTVTPGRIVVIVLGVALAWGLFLLWALQAEAQTPASCTHYASPQGQGAVCTHQQPCKVASWWPLAGPGKTLCLKDGLYRGEDSMILPPAGTRGSASQPLTVRAEHDGAVTLDAQHTSFAVWLGWHTGPPRSNDWMVVEGVGAHSAAEAVFQVSSADSQLRRVIGWDGTSGVNPYVFNIVGLRSRAIDCAGWGMNIRKTFNGSQSGNLQGAGYTRCWGEWNDHPQGDSNPNETFEMGYNSTNQRFENVIGTWDTRGQNGSHESILHVFRGFSEEPNEMEGSTVLGSIFYARNGANYPNGMPVVSGFATRNLVLQDVVAFVGSDYPRSAPFFMLDQDCTSSDPCTGNVCTHCLAIHAGVPSILMPDAGWTMPGLHEGRGLAAATGGRSAFELLPGICRRYEGGVLTDQPLWPWPMNDRITAARVQSGFRPVDVTAEVEQALGPIPAACKTGGPPPGPGGDTEAPRVTLTAPSHEALVSGVAVAVSADATDNVGVVGIRFFLDGVQVGTEQAGASVHVLADSTTVANGLHKLKAVARDQAGNEGTSGTIDVTVFNSPTVPPQGSHPDLACTGAIGAGGSLSMRCMPEEVP